MTMRDLHNNALAVNAMAPQTITTSALNTGDEDLFGFNSALVVVVPGSIDGLNAGSPSPGAIAVKLEHANDDGTGAAGAYTNVTDADVIGVTGISAGVVNTFGESNAGIFQCGYKGERRFIKVTLTPSGLGAGGPVAVQVIKGHPRHVPAGGA